MSEPSAHTICLWLGGTFLSIIAGLAITVVAAVTGVWIGVVTGIVGLARGRTGDPPAKPPGPNASRR